MLIKPSKESIKSIKGNLKEVFSTNQNSTAGELIRTVQPISTGWGNNFRHVVAKDKFADIDDHICKLSWKWASKKHPTRISK